MNDISYQSAPVAVRPDITAAHARGWQRLARAGTWLKAERRLAIAREVRQAPGCTLCRERRQALSPYAVTGSHDDLGELPEAVVEMIHRIRTDSGRLTQDWYQGIIAAGVSEEEYVETVAVIVTVVAIDTFARAIGQPAAALPDAIEGEPTRQRPAGAKHGGAWVPWLAPEDAEGAESDLYPVPTAPHIYRAMSLVPNEVRGFFDLTECQYLEGIMMRDFGTEFRAINHAQIELVAGRVSSLNQCLY